MLISLKNLAVGIINVFLSIMAYAPENFSLINAVEIVDGGMEVFTPCALRSE